MGTIAQMLHGMGEFMHSSRERAAEEAAHGPREHPPTPLRLELDVLPDEVAEVPEFSRDV